LQDTHQAAAESPASFDSVLIHKSVYRHPTQLIASFITNGI